MSRIFPAKTWDRILLRRFTPGFCNPCFSVAAKRVRDLETDTEPICFSRGKNLRRYSLFCRSESTFAVFKKPGKRRSLASHRRKLEVQLTWQEAILCQGRREWKRSCGKNTCSIRSGVLQSPSLRVIPSLISAWTIQVFCSAMVGEIAIWRNPRVFCCVGIPFDSSVCPALLR